MPRTARRIFEDCFYHVFNRGNNHQEVFRQPDDFRRFLWIVARAKKKYPVKIMAYCLMPNHFHILLQNEKDKAIGRFMRWAMTVYNCYYLKKYSSCGHIWQGRYQSILVKEENAFVTELRYIEGNPVRARLVKSALHWPWSSIGERNETSGRQRGLSPETLYQRSRYLRVHVIDSLPIRLPFDWVAYVNRPLTEKEKDKMRGRLAGK